MLAIGEVVAIICPVGSIAKKAPAGVPRDDMVRFAPFKSERLPFLSMVSTVVVAKSEVEVEIAKRFSVPPAAPAREKFAKGEVVPMPTLPAVVINIVEVPTAVLVPLKYAI